VLAGTLSPAFSAFAKVSPSARRIAHIRELRKQRTAAERQYRYRLRYKRKGPAIVFWMRVKHLRNVNEDVPFSLVVSTDKRSQNVLRSKAFVSRVPDSHIVRGHVMLGRQEYQKGKPLFCNLLLGQENARTKVWQLGQQSKKA
jgi:hypothetical protein